VSPLKYYLAWVC